MAVHDLFRSLLQFIPRVHVRDGLTANALFAVSPSLIGKAQRWGYRSRIVQSFMKLIDNV